MYEYFISDEPARISVHTIEGHPGLLETLQINNNKQVLPILAEDSMSNDPFSCSFFHVIYLFSIF